MGKRGGGDGERGVGEEERGGGGGEGMRGRLHLEDASLSRGVPRQHPGDHVREGHPEGKSDPQIYRERLHAVGKPTFALREGGWGVGESG